MLLLNKIDLVPEEAKLKALEGRLRSLNKWARMAHAAHAGLTQHAQGSRTLLSLPAVLVLRRWAPIERCTNAGVALEKILSIRGFELDRVLEMDPEFLNVDGEHMHDDRVSPRASHRALPAPLTHPSEALPM